MRPFFISVEGTIAAGKCLDPDSPVQAWAAGEIASYPLWRAVASQLPLVGPAGSARHVRSVHVGMTQMYRVTIHPHPPGRSAGTQHGNVPVISCAWNHTHVCVVVANASTARRCARCHDVADLLGLADGRRTTPAGPTLHLSTILLARAVDTTTDDVATGCVCGERLRPALLRQLPCRRAWVPVEVSVDPVATVGPYLGVTLARSPGDADDGDEDDDDGWPASYHVLANGIVTHNSSFAAALRRRLPGTHVFPEPVATNPFLPSFYRDPRQFALPLQLWMFEQRATTYRRALTMLQGMDGGGVVLDRSVWSDWTFAAAVRDEGHLTDHQMRQYLSIRRHLGQVLPRLETVVALDVEPAEALRRIREVRQRPVEAGISLAYLTVLQRHLDTFIRQDPASGLAPYAPTVIRLDWSTFGEGAALPTPPPLTADAAATLAAFRPSDVDHVLAELAELRAHL